MQIQLLLENENKRQKAGSVGYYIIFPLFQLWNDLALIMGSGDDGEQLKDKVTTMTRQVCDDYAAHVLEDVQPTDGEFPTSP